MKKFTIILLVMVVTAFAGTAMAQFTLDQDVLGAHNVNGRGCVSCHLPHSGSAGSGGTDTSTGSIVLWGISFIGKTYTNQGGTTFTTYPTVASFVNGTKDPLYRTAVCLTCHDGSASISGMHGTTVETVDGLAGQRHRGLDQRSPCPHSVCSGCSSRWQALGGNGGRKRQSVVDERSGPGSIRRCLRSRRQPVWRCGGGYHDRKRYALNGRRCIC